MIDGPPIGIWLSAAAPAARMARVLADAMPGVPLVSAGRRFGRAARAGHRTTAASLDAWLAGEELRPAREPEEPVETTGPGRAAKLGRGAALIVFGLEPWAAAMPRLLLRRPDLRVIAIIEDTTVRQWPEFSSVAAAASAPEALAAVASRAAVILSDTGDVDLFVAAGVGARVIVEPVPSRLAGTEAGPLDSPLPDGPYMVACGPIEARSNTLLLLHLWRDALNRGATLPKLVLAGERGQQIEEIAPLLDWNTALRPLVAEAPGLSPATLRRLLGGAGALLVPDFAGPPAALMRDCLALGIPVVAADTAAARRLGATPRLDPLDGPGWRAAIAAIAPPPRQDRPPLPNWPGYATRLLAAIGALL